MAQVINFKENFKDEPSREVIFNSQNLRIVRFFLREGQEVKPHSAPATVSVVVLRGELSFYTEGGERVLGEGETIIYDKGEKHGFKALKESVVQAFIFKW